MRPPVVDAPVTQTLPVDETQWPQLAEPAELALELVFDDFTEIIAAVESTIEIGQPAPALEIADRALEARQTLSGLETAHVQWLSALALETMGRADETELRLRRAANALRDPEQAQVRMSLLEEQLDVVEPGAVLERGRLQWFTAVTLLALGRRDEAEVYVRLAAQALLSAELSLPSFQRVLAEGLVEHAPVQGESMAPATENTNGVIVVELSLASDFSPFDGGMAVGATASWYPRNHRLEELPPFELIEPRWRGDQQLYGAVRLGVIRDQLFSFAFDAVETGEPLLWFDKNANFDLTDDGPPLENRGEGVFATDIRLDMGHVLPNFVAEEPFRIWFFSNDALWQKRYASHYCLTVMKGTVILDGVAYDVYVADTGFNEADFRDDGVYVDTDADGNVSRDDLIPHQGVLQLGGSRYQFKIKE